MQLHHHRDVRRKIRVLDEARASGNVSHTCRKHGVSRDTFYRWERQRTQGGLEALINSKPCPQNPKLRVSKEIEDKVLHVRREFGLGQRYHGLTVSSSGVFGILKRNGMSRLPRGAPKRSPSTFIRYEKVVPGHQVQIDGKHSSNPVLPPLT